MSTKIKSILQESCRGGVLCSSWLEARNVSRMEQVQYVRSWWLARMAPGVYYFANTYPTLYGTLASMDKQVGLAYRIAASSALELHGYTHYLSLGLPQAHIFTPIKRHLPKWMASHEWDRTLHEYSTGVFDDIVGVTTLDQGDITLRVSSPELAIMECLQFAPGTYNLTDVYHLMESLSTLRSPVISQLLERCGSVKVKRLFLYMAEKANHPWFKHTELSKVAMGSGPRSFVKGGVTISKCGIVVPKELAEYE